MSVPHARRSGAAAALRLAAALVLGIAGCDGTEVGPLQNPAPVLESIEPTLVNRTSSSAEVALRGLGFVEGADARWDGATRPTTFVDPTQLVVTLAPQDLLAASGEIDVVNPAPGGGTSASLTLLVGNPSPTLSSISPSQTAAVVTQQLVLQAEGTDFIVGTPASTLRWNGLPLQTSVASATQLSAVVPDYLLRAGHAAQITVANPSPGGGASNALVFAVENPVPVVDATDPPGVPALEAVSLDVIGSGFVHGAQVWIGSSELVPTSVSSTRVRVQVPGTATGGGAPTISLHVRNPGPGGGQSNAVDLQVWVTPPRIDELFPAAVFAGSPDFNLLIVGANFDPAAVVTIDGTPLTATFVSTARIEVSVPAAVIALEGTLDVVVTNPGSSGQASADLVVLEQSSGGSTLLAERSDGSLAILDLNGTTITTIALPSSGYRVDASPIGSTALYQNGRLYQVDPYGGMPRRVTGGAADAALGEEQWGRYTADGAWIYFMGNSSQTGRWEIWRAPAAGGSSERILAHGSQSVGYPSLSHQGNRIAYAVGVSEGSLAQLTVLDLTTGTSRSLGVQGGTSRWSPTDDWIVYWTWGRELRAVRPDGTGDFALTSGINIAAGFDFSPTGERIIAAREDGSGPVIIDFPSGAVHPLSSMSVGSMAWYGP